MPSRTQMTGYSSHCDQVLNTPAQAISVGNSDTLVISKVTVDNSAGDTDDLGHNTDVRSMNHNPFWTH